MIKVIPQEGGTSQKRKGKDRKREKDICKAELISVDKRLSAQLYATIASANLLLKLSLAVPKIY